MKRENKVTKPTFLMAATLLHCIIYKPQLREDLSRKYREKRAQMVPNICQDIG